VFSFRKKSAMEKLDLSKKYKSYYSAKIRPELVDVGEGKFLSISGIGDPSQQEFADRVEALYTVAYSVKFKYKSLHRDFVVARLEGIWWFDEATYKNVTIQNAPKIIKREDWMYTLLIRVPDYVEDSVVNSVRREVIARKELKILADVTLRKIQEGKSVQILHKGPFDKEPDTLKKLEAFMEINNLRRNGRHHEIYLSDFRKTPPEKLKTILREPVR
jgi:hypothetical protein